MSLGFRERRKKIEKVFPRELEGLAIKIDQEQGMDTIQVVAGADLGSTNTRMVIASKHMLPDDSNRGCEKDYVVIPSQFKYVPEINDDVIDPRDNSGQVYEMLDTSISFVARKDKEDIDKNKSLVKDMRIVRGGKYGSVNYIESNILTEQSKVESLNYNANLIDGLGWATVISYAKRGLKIPKNIEVIVGVSLRPDENKSVYVDKLKKNLLHKYNWKANDLGIEIGITIKDLVSETEPGALVKKFCSEEESLSMILNAMGGGSNSSTDIIDSNGISIENGSKQFKICGTFQDAILQKEYTNERAKLGLAPQTLTRAELDRLIMYGVIEESGKIVHKEDLVRRVKRVIGTQLGTDIQRELFSNSSASLKSMNSVIFSGNLFKRSKFGGHNYDEQLEDLFEEIAELREQIEESDSATLKDKLSEKMKQAVELEKLVKEYHPSIADFIVDNFKQVAPDVQMILVNQNLIPIGNLYNVMDNFPEVIDSIIDEYNELHPEENEEEEELSLEEVTSKEVASSLEDSVPSLDDIDTSIDIDSADYDVDEDSIMEGLKNM